MTKYIVERRTLLTLLLFLVCTCLCKAQLPPVQWGAKVQSLTVNYPEAYITKVMAGMQGGVYVLGFFTDSIAPDSNNSALVYGNQLSNEFISRYDANGNFLWLKVFNRVHIGDLYQDKRGNIFIGGRFDYATTVDLDPGVGVANATTTTQGAFFFAKYDADLNYMWAKVLPSSNFTDNGVTVIRTDTVSGNIYIGGRFVLFADMDPGPGDVSIANPGTYINCSGCTIGFYAKYDSTGALLWARHEATTSSINDLEVVTKTGNIIIGASGGNGAFRYVLANGTSVDSVYSGGYGQYVSDAFTDGAGNLYFAGGVGNSNADFDWGPAQVIRSAPSIIDHRYFICKYDSSRVFQWVNLYELDSTVGLVYSFNVSLTSDNNFLTAFRGHSGSLPGVGFCKLYNANTFIPEWIAAYRSVPAITGGHGGAYLTYHPQSESFYTATNYGTSYPGYAISLDMDVNQTSYVLAGRGEVGFLAKYGNCIAPPDVPGAITGATSLCAAGAQTYSVAAVPGAVSYAWTLPSGWSGSSTTNSITVLPSANGGAISVAANNGCGAGVPRLLNVSYSVPPSVGITSTATTLCAGSQVTLTGSGATTYTWSNGVTNGVAFSPAATAVYTITGTSAGCSHTASITINVNANPVAAISPATISICNGASANLTASGGAAYTWSNSLGSNAAVSVSPATATTYTVTVTDGNTCSATASKLITVNQLPVAAINGPTTICSGLSAMLTASGGVGYSWNNGLGTNAQVTVTPTSTTVYNVTVTDGNNCSTTATQSVSVTSTPTASITGPTQICTGESAALTANGGNNYQWANGLGTNSTITTSPTGVTTYTVTATIGASCSATASHTVTVYQPAASQFSQTICTGQSYNYNDIAQTTSGTYIDTLQTVNGCDSIVTLNLTVNPVLTGSFNQAVCAGGSYTFNGVALTQGGTYADTIQNGSGCDSVVILTLVVNSNMQTALSDTICTGDVYSFEGTVVTSAGIYTDTLQTITGCDSVISLTLTVNSLPLPIIARSNDTLYTHGFAIYQWLFNDIVLLGATAGYLVITTNGNYAVFVTDSFGCRDTSAVFNATGVGIESVVTAWGGKLYPNPNTGNFIIEFTDDATRTIEITDAIGRVIVAEHSILHRRQIDMGQSSTGIYFINIKENEQTRSLKFSLIR